MKYRISQHKLNQIIKESLESVIKEYQGRFKEPDEYTRDMQQFLQQAETFKELLKSKYNVEMGDKIMLILNNLTDEMEEIVWDGSHQPLYKNQ